MRWDMGRKTCQFIPKKYRGLYEYIYEKNKLRSLCVRDYHYTVIFHYYGD